MGQLVMLSIEAVRNNRSERYPILTSFLNELLSQLWFGGKMWILLALWQPFGSSVGQHIERVMNTLIRPMATDTDHAVIDFSNTSQILPRDVSRCLAFLTIPCFIDN